MSSLNLIYNESGALEHVHAHAHPKSLPYAQGTKRPNGEPFVSLTLARTSIYLTPEQARAAAELLLDAVDKVAPLDLRPLRSVV